MSWVMGASQAAVSKMRAWAPHIILGQFPAQADFVVQGAPGIQEQFLAGLARERKLPLLDFRLLIRDYDVAALYTSTSNHFNEQGNMAVAGIFLEEILPLCQKIKKGV